MHRCLLSRPQCLTLYTASLVIQYFCLWLSDPGGLLPAGKHMSVWARVSHKAFPAQQALGFAHHCTGCIITSCPWIQLSWNLISFSRLTKAQIELIFLGKASQVWKDEWVRETTSNLNLSRKRRNFPDGSLREPKFASSKGVRYERSAGTLCISDKSSMLDVNIQNAAFKLLCAPMATFKK